MAGSYVDVVSNRMLLDVDGSRIHPFLGSSFATFGPTEMAIVCNEDSDDLGPLTSSDLDAFHIVFPEKRDVHGLYLGMSQASSTDWVDVLVEASTNTTDGIDGVWTEVFATNRVQDGATTGWWGHTATGDYRRYIRATASATACKALRATLTPQSGSTVFSIVSVHVFGTVSAEFAGDRLAFWHPTLDMRVPGGYFDWGNAPLGSSADRTFRIKNLSSVHRASGIHLWTDALTDTVPSVPAQHYLSAGGGSFAPTITIPLLGVGALSRTLTLRRMTPSDADTGPWALRVRAAATDWTAVVLP